MKTKIRNNWKAGVTVSLVSIPLSVSLAVASHASPIMGIITAVWAGMIAALFGGSNFNVVGPTGALSGILALYAIEHGAEALASVAILSGIFIYIAYLLRFEKYLVFVPGSAVHGFTLGVALIIGLNQLSFAIGTAQPSHERFIDNVSAAFAAAPSGSGAVFGIFAVALALLFVWKRWAPNFPGAIVIAPLGIVLGYLATIGTVAINIPTLGSLYPDIRGTLYLPHTLSFAPEMFGPALTIALVAILETMISAKIADGMTQTKHHRRKEIRGLSLANIASGIMGGIPATAALARTSLNIHTGASSYMSAVISSVCIASISLFFLAYFQYIPLAIIAAILVYVAVQMVEVEHFKRMFRYDRSHFYVSLLVVFATVYIDPMIGIMLGVGISVLLLSEKLSRGQFDLIINDQNRNIIEHISGDRLMQIIKNSDTAVYSIKGLLCYINSEAHIHRFSEHLNGSKHIILRLRSVYYIDTDGVEAISEIIRIVRSRGKQIYITSVSPIIVHMLDKNPEFQKLKAEGRVFAKSADVLRHLGYQIPS